MSESALIALVVVVVGAAALTSVSVIDLRRRRIPNHITYSAAGMCLVAAAIGSTMGHGDRALSGLLGAFLFSGILYVPRRLRPTSMGLGDVKLAWPLGFAIGWTQTRLLATALTVGWTIAGASMIGLAMAWWSARSRAEPMRSGQAVAFGPALSAAGALAVLSAIV